jgi:signal transduction histidine kinase
VNDRHGVQRIVSDTGPGIPPEARGRVFDRFYRHDTSAGTGSGLGLAIVREIATRHGASVTLADASAQGGLCVTVAFPRAN